MTIGSNKDELYDLFEKTLLHNFIGGGLQWTKISEVLRTKHLNIDSYDLIFSCLFFPCPTFNSFQLLDACVNNCGRPFHLEICSRDFVSECRTLIGQKVS